jgi:hypothetical protein
MYTIYPDFLSRLNSQGSVVRFFLNSPYLALTRIGSPFLAASQGPRVGLSLEIYNNNNNNNLKFYKILKRIFKNSLIIHEQITQS